MLLTIFYCDGIFGCYTHSLPLVAASFRIPIACSARTVPTRAEPPEPRLAAEILLGVGGR
jgi:hypothetical protein